MSEVDRLLELVPLLIGCPGLAQLRGGTIQAPVVAFAELPPQMGLDELDLLRSRALILAAGRALSSMEELCFQPDFAIPSASGQATARLALVGPPALFDQAMAGPPWPVILLPAQQTWLAHALGHGAASGVDPDEDLLLVALALASDSILWVGAPPARGAAILTGASAGGSAREVLCARGYARWWPGQGTASPELCAQAWNPIARQALEKELSQRLSQGPRARTDLLPGLVSRAAFSIEPKSDLLPHNHDKWLELCERLYEGLAHRGETQQASREVKKYQVFWSGGRAQGHNSPGIVIYQMVREYFLRRGARSLLDVGCGAGEVLEAAQGDGLEVIGLDIADGLTGTPRETLRDKLILAPAWQMPLEDGCVDVFFSSDVLEHLPPSCVPAALDQLQRVSRHGGALAISGRADISGLAWGALLHLAVFPLEYWRKQLESRFHIELARVTSEESNPFYLFLLAPLQTH